MTPAARTLAAAASDAQHSAELAFPCAGSRRTRTRLLFAQSGGTGGRVVSLVERTTPLWRRAKRWRV